MEIDSFSVYADLDILADNNRTQKVDNVQELEAKYKKLLVDFHRKDFELSETKKELEIITLNFFGLLSTARAEITRKDSSIQQLRTEIDQLIFRRNKRAETFAVERRAPQQRCKSPVVKAKDVIKNTTLSKKLKNDESLDSRSKNVELHKTVDSSCAPRRKLIRNRAKSEGLERNYNNAKKSDISSQKEKRTECLELQCLNYNTTPNTKCSVNQIDANISSNEDKKQKPNTTDQISMRTESQGKQTFQDALLDEMLFGNFGKSPMKEDDTDLDLYSSLPCSPLALPPTISETEMAVKSLLATEYISEENYSNVLTDTCDTQTEENVTSTSPVRTEIEAASTIVEKKSMNLSIYLSSFIPTVEITEQPPLPDATLPALNIQENNNSKSDTPKNDPCLQRNSPVLEAKEKQKLRDSLGSRKTKKLVGHIIGGFEPNRTKNRSLVESSRNLKNALFEEALSYTGENVPQALQTKPARGSKTKQSKQEKKSSKILETSSLEHGTAVNIITEDINSSSNAYNGEKSRQDSGNFNKTISSRDCASNSATDIENLNRLPSSVKESINVSLPLTRTGLKRPTLEKCKRNLKDGVDCQLEEVNLTEFKEERNKAVEILTKVTASKKLSFTTAAVSEKHLNQKSSESIDHVTTIFDINRDRMTANGGNKIDSSLKSVIQDRPENFEKNMKKRKIDLDSTINEVKRQKKDVFPTGTIKGITERQSANEKISDPEIHDKKQDPLVAHQRTNIPEEKIRSHSPSKHLNGEGIQKHHRRIDRIQSFTKHEIAEKPQTQTVISGNCMNISSESNELKENQANKDNEHQSSQQAPENSIELNSSQTEKVKLSISCSDYIIETVDNVLHVYVTRRRSKKQNAKKKSK